MPLQRTGFFSSIDSYISPLLLVLFLIFGVQNLLIGGVVLRSGETLGSVFRRARADAKGLPFLFIFQTMLDAVAIMHLIETFWLDEHFLPLQQTSDT